MDPAPTSPSVIYIGQHGTSASGFATIAWLEATPDDWPHVTRGWDETRAHVTHRHRIPVDTEILRSVEPESSTANHRRQRALSNALHTISNQNIRIGSVYTRTTPDNHRTEQDALHTALLQQINTRLEDDGKFGILFTTTELPPPPKFGLHRILETATPPQHLSRHTNGQHHRLGRAPTPHPPRPTELLLGPLPRPSPHRHLRRTACDRHRNALG